MSTNPQAGPQRADWGAEPGNEEGGFLEGVSGAAQGGFFFGP